MNTKTMETIKSICMVVMASLVVLSLHQARVSLQMARNAVNSAWESQIAADRMAQAVKDAQKAAQDAQTGWREAVNLLHDFNAAQTHNPYANMWIATNKLW